MKMKKAQEELVGFALIIIIVAIILLVFLGFGLREKEIEVQSYEAQNFLNSVLYYTSECQNNQGYLQIRKLISFCERRENCLDGTDSCEILKKDLSGITQETWGKKNNVKGYILNINSSQSIVNIEKGNQTLSYKIATENLGQAGYIKIVFKVFY